MGWDGVQPDHPAERRTGAGPGRGARQRARRLQLRLDAEQCAAGVLRELAGALAEHRADGRCAVWVEYVGSGARVELAFRFRLASQTVRGAAAPVAGAGRRKGSTIYCTTSNRLLIVTHLDVEPGASSIGCSLPSPGVRAGTYRSRRVVCSQVSQSGHPGAFLLDRVLEPIVGIRWGVGIEPEAVLIRIEARLMTPAYARTRSARTSPDRRPVGYRHRWRSTGDNNGLRRLTEEDRRLDLAQVDGRPPG